MDEQRPTGAVYQRPIQHEHWNPVEFLAHWFQAHLPSETQEPGQEATTNSHPRNEQGVKNREEQHAKAPPYATLYFDQDKQCTVAVLSTPTEALSVYFGCRIDQKTAQQRSVLYYELDGFIRENFTSLKRQRYLGTDGLRIAVGSLEASDLTQSKKLEQERTRRIERQRVQMQQFTHCQFEQVMEIVRLHWLNDGLDTLSVYFLSQVGRSMRCLAQKIASDRIQQLQVLVTPLVDGTSLDGFSTFTRTHSTAASSLVRHVESGRTIEYHQKQSIVLSHRHTGTFVPVETKDSDLDVSSSLHSSNKSCGNFSWMCEELALGNLHRRWCYNLEYSGQKMVVSCVLPPADVVDSSHGDTIRLSAVRLENNPKCGTRTLSSSHAQVVVDVLESEMRQLDVVAILYSGRARIESVSVNFMALVRAVARQSLLLTQIRMETIKETRPLLDHEKNFLRLVEEAAV